MTNDDSHVEYGGPRHGRASLCCCSADGWTHSRGDEERNLGQEVNSIPPSSRWKCVCWRGWRSWRIFSYKEDQLRTYGRTAIVAGAFWWDDWDEFFRGHGGVCSCSASTLELKCIWPYRESRWLSFLVKSVNMFTKHGASCVFRTKSGCCMPYFRHPLKQCWTLPFPTRSLRGQASRSHRQNKALWPMRLKAIDTSRCHLSNYAFGWNPVAMATITSEQSCINMFLFQKFVSSHPFSLLHQAPPTLSPKIPNDQDDAKKAQEQLRQLTACVKEAAKAKRDQKGRKALDGGCFGNRWIQFWKRDTLWRWK